MGWVFILIHRSISPCAFSPICYMLLLCCCCCVSLWVGELLVVGWQEDEKRKNSFLVVWLPISKIARMLLLWDNRKTFPTYLSNTKNTRARAVLDSYIVATHFSLQLYLLSLHVLDVYMYIYRLDTRVKVQLVFFFFGDGVSTYVDGWIWPLHVCVVCCAGCYIYIYIYSVFLFYLRGFRKECTTASLLVCVCV